MAQYGLTNSNTGAVVPLKDIQIKADIHGFVAGVEATFTYRNEESNPIEALFTFPLDEGSAVYKFEAEIDGRLVAGECQEKVQAQQTYQDAVAAGQSAFLLKESDAAGDIFECSVGNLPPATEALIRFAYVMEMAVEGDGAVRFVSPAVLGHRFGDPSKPLLSSPARSIVGRPGASAPVTASVDKDDLPYTVTFTAEIYSDHRIKKIAMEESDDEIRTEFSHKNTHAEVTLTSRYVFDHDLTLLVWYTQPFEPHVILENGEASDGGFLGKDVAMLNFCPDLSSARGLTQNGQGEYIFVVDRSGSMGGDRMHAARQSLAKFLENLPDDCYFNIISFGSGYDVLFDRQSLKKSPVTMKRARTLQKSMMADMGGTQMVTPFEFIYDTMPRIPGYPRQIFLLTDGGICNAEQLFQLVKDNVKTARVFTFGIGHGVSTQLVKGVARAGKGTWQYVTDHLSRLSVKVLHTLKCAMQPSVDDVTVTWSTPTGVTVATLPSELPPLFLGERLIVYGVLVNPKKRRNEKVVVTLKGRVDGKPIEHKLDFSLDDGNAENSTLMIHRLAAKVQIKEWEETDGQNATNNKNQVIMLSTSANIISKYTAYVGVDKGRVEKIKGKPEKRIVPLAHREPTRGKQTGKKIKTLSPHGASSSSAPHPAPVMMTIARPIQAGGGHNYGGGSADAPMASKYLDGKKSSSMLQPGNPSKSSGAGTTLPGEPQRKRKGGRNGGNGWTHKKQRKPEVAVCDQLFAPRRDGDFYPVIKQRRLVGECVEVHFRDGCSAVVKAGELLEARRLSALDDVGVKSDRGGYIRALVLEYCMDTDSLVVARTDGTVEKVKPRDMMFPAQTGKKLLDVTIGNLDCIRVCMYRTSNNGMPCQILTADLSELREDGWISYNIVQLFLSQLWSELPEETQRLCHFFGPEVFGSLEWASVLDELHFTRQRDRFARYARVRGWSRGVDLRQQRMLFMPVFDMVHWYVIAVKITPLEGSDGKDTNKFRARFIVMDSYFTGERFEEAMLIRWFLKAICEEQGVTIEFDECIWSPKVPVQTNQSDCGICMLLNIEQSCKEGLNPQPKLDWYPDSAPWKLRQKLGRLVMDMSAAKG